MIVDGKTVEVGTVVSFTSKNENDPITYQGTVKSIGDYDVARNYGDIINYHQEVLNSVEAGSIEEDPTLLTYLVIKLASNEWFVMAGDWVQSLTIIDVTSTKTIALYGATAEDTTAALKLLRDNGFKCKLIE